MPSTSETVDKAATLIRQRIAELDAERRRLEQALSGLGARRGPGRPRASSGRTVRRPRRRRRAGTRAEQALKVISDNPGITPSQIAERLGIKPNYMYRVMNEMVKDNAVVKKGRGYFPR